MYVIFFESLDNRAILNLTIVNNFRSFAESNKQTNNTPMKTLRRIALTLSIAYILLCALAQVNYRQAMNCARLSEGTDKAIEQIMYEHGFEVEALDTSPISMSKKITALTKL